MRARLKNWLSNCPAGIGGDDGATPCYGCHEGYWPASCLLRWWRLPPASVRF